MTLSAEQFDVLIEILGNRPEIETAYLHGSAAKGTLRPDSDLDIAILPPPGKTFPMKARLDCAASIESVLHRTVDLGLLSTNNLIYAKEVIEHGKELFSKNPFHAKRFLATCLSMYADLQQQRKEVINAYSALGMKING